MSAAGKRGYLPAVLALCLMFLLPAALSACAARQAPPPAVTPVPAGPDVQAIAAAQATAIIQQAQATALVLQAQAKATALLAGASIAPGAGDPSAAAGTAGTDSAELAETSELESIQTTPEPGAPTEETVPVEIIRVGYAAEGGFIIVTYTAEPDVADTFWPGMLSITDEESGTVYNEVPVMPKIGPMISRPAAAGQVGYVMFVNPPPGLEPGTLVTVTLVNYIFEHLKVE